MNLRRRTYMVGYQTNSSDKMLDRRSDCRMEKSMNQDTFIRAFQEALVGKVSENIIQENIDYYRNYIRMQIDQGRTEAEVLEMLGDPRLLAKTVVETQNFSDGDQATYRESYSKTQEQRSAYSDEMQENKPWKAPRWLITVLVILILLAVLRVAFSVISFFAPVIIMGLVIFFAIRVLKSIFDS